MSTIPLAITVGMYIMTAIGFYQKNKYGLALAFLCYAAANLGILWEGNK